MTTIRTDSSIISATETPSAATIRGDTAILPADAAVAANSTVRASDAVIQADVTPTGTLRSNDTPAVTAPSSNASLEVGNTLHLNNRSYNVEKILSLSSGEAEVYLLSRGDQKVVFKWYYQTFKPKGEILDKLRALQHPDIVNIQESSYHESRFYELQDYAAGGSLDQHLPIKDVARIKQIISETVNAFKYLHSHGILHKDIKPANLYFKNHDATDILVADFGISSMLDSEASRCQTKQGFSIGYAAPEMYGYGNQMIVGKEVDYYALGISIIHIWQGKAIFEGFSDHAAINLTTTGKVADQIPDDLPKELQNFVKGSITIDFEKRWGYDEVQRWLCGEDVPVYFQYATNDDTYLFEKAGGKDITASTTVELARLLEQNSEKGMKQLYSKSFCQWLQKINPDLNEKIIDIVEVDYPKSQSTGLKKAIYLLAPEDLFKSRNNSICKTPDDIANALEEDAGYYVKELADRHSSLYIYIEARENKLIADKFHKIISSTSPPLRALNTLLLELRGTDIYRIGDQEFRSPEQLLTCHNNERLQELLLDENSTALIWIQGFYGTGDYLETLEKFVASAVSNGVDVQKKICLSHVIATFAAKKENATLLAITTNLLRKVSPDHPLLKNIGDSICHKVEQLRQENTKIANDNSLLASKPMAELVLLLLIPLAICSMPFFKIIPQELIDICLKSFIEGAVGYLAGIILVAATLLYANYRKMKIIGWLVLCGIIGALAVNYLLAPWALVVLLSFYPASASLAALFVPKLYMRWSQARSISKSASQSQLLFSETSRFEAYKAGASNFISSFTTQAQNNWNNSHSSGGLPPAPDFGGLKTDVSMPERSLHFPMLLMRGGGVVAVSAALILSGKYVSAKYDTKMTEISLEQVQAKAMIATTKGEASLRLSASAKSKKMATLDKGAKVKILEQKSEWTHVHYKNLDGYIKSSLLQINK